MNELKLSFLGPPRVEINGVSIEIQRRRGTALLAYLAVTGERQPRAHLAALFWPESDHDRSHKALRRDLSELNLALEGQWLDIDRESVGVRAGTWLDVAQFQQQLADCANNPAACRTDLKLAADLYRGDFLAGFTLADSSQFDEWQFFQTEHLRQAFASALARLVDLLSDQDEDKTAIVYARRWSNLDPLHEPAHRRLMQLYTRTDQQAAALRQYESCRQLLADELDVLPAPETTALYEQIRTRKIVPVDARARQSAVVAAPRHNLPTQTTAFLGREQEVADIQRLLLQEPGCRLLTLMGPGGIGKTRLALAAAASVVHSFNNGVFFVSLAPVGEVAYIVPAIAEDLHFTFHGNSDPKEQLLAYLSQRHLLLILDNFEHLLDGANLLSEILRHAADVVLLVTARERLNLREEWSYEVQGLAFPTTNNQSVNQSAEFLTTYSAVQLFLQRARQADAAFMPSSEEIADIVRICQLVQGMPLGLELAAPWIRSLGCRDIAVEIERSLDFLTTTLRNMPQRHRSLRVLFEQTWQRLSVAEQAVLRQLSVFRGGCTREAAEQVTQATLGVLSSLVDKALLRRINTGRYELHELIRQFAEAQLQSDPQAIEQARQRHQDYFITFLESRTSAVKGARQQATLVEIQADMDNVRLAWRRAVAEQDAHALERSAECLFVYYIYGNGYDEGQKEFRQAVSAFASVADAPTVDGLLQALIAPDQPENLVGYLLAAQGYFLAHRYNLPAGQRLLEQALALLRRARSDDRRKRAFALLWLGWTLYFQGRNAQAKPYLRESLALFTEVSDPWGEGWSLLGLGNSIRDGRPAQAEELLRQGLVLCQENGDQNVLSYFAFNLGSVVRQLGYYAQAQQYIDMGVRIAEELNNILGLGYALFRLGQLEIAQGNYWQAIQSLQQSISHFNEVGAVHASMARVYLGTAFHLAGDHNRAARLYAQSLEEFTEADNKPWLARCLSRFGTLAYDRHDFHQAEHYLSEALAVWQVLIEQEAALAITLCHMGQVLVASSNHRAAEARQYFLQALSLAAQHRLAPIALEVCLGMGRLLAQAGEAEQAIELLALAAQHESGTFETRQMARQSLAEILERLPAAASQTQGRALDLWETVHNLLNTC